MKKLTTLLIPLSTFLIPHSSFQSPSLGEGVGVGMVGDPSIRKGTLHNGLTYYIQHNNKWPSNSSMHTAA